MVNGLKWAEGTRPEPMRHYSFFPDIDLDDLKTRSLISAIAIDMAEEAIVNAVLSVAKAEGITDLYVMDRKFVLDALKEKIERERGKE